MAARRSPIAGQSPSVARAPKPASARVCTWAGTIFVAAYLFALAIFLIGTFGLFGQERDPLAGVFLVPLGLPWNRVIDLLLEASWPWQAAAAPLLNLGIVAAVCPVLRLRRQR